MKNKKKVVAIIQARMGSIRLPGKVMLPLAGKPILWHIIERAKRCKEVNSIVVATTTNHRDKIIMELANECGIKSFAGSENDVLDRYYRAAKEFNADIVVRICADCPLINPTTIDKMIGLCLEEDADCICGHPSYPSIEQGMGVVTFLALEKIKNLAKKDYQKEHVTIFIRENPELFKIVPIIPEERFQREDMRLTIDAKEDYRLMQEIYDRLYVVGEIIKMESVIELLENNPKLKEINSKVEMSNANKYGASQMLKKKILKIFNEKR